MKKTIVKEKFYYLREQGSNAPLVTKCLVLADDGTIGSGMSICSPLDRPKLSREYGRKEASRRARKALYHPKPHPNDLVTRSEALSVISRLREDSDGMTNYLLNKSVNNPRLTVFEERLLGNAYYEMMEHV